MIPRRALFSIVALPGLLGCTAPPQEPPSPPSDTLSAVGERLDEYLSRLEPFGFSGAVLVAEGEEIRLDAGYGFADQEAAIPNTADTVFQVASITKQFTAAAIMALAVDGRLRTTDTLPSFFSDVPADKEPITLRQLLTHTSGVLAGDTEYFDGNSRSEIVAMVLAEPLRFAPGESFLYSNMGYALLAAVIEEVSGTSYENYLRQRLLLPAGMRSTGYRLSSWRPNSVAHWYADGVDNGDQLDHLYPDWNFIGSGRIRSTTGDLFGWHRALMSDEVLPAAAKQEMYTPILNDYAYGWVVSDTDRGRLIRHNGASSDGAAAEFRRYVDEDLVIVVFSNVNGEQMLFGNRLADHIDDLAHGIDLDLPPRVSADAGIDLEPFVGIYRTDSGLEIEIEVLRDMLVARGRGQGAVDALYGAKRFATGKTVSDMAQKALIGLVERGDTTDFAALVADADRSERLAGYVLDNRTEGESELGTYRLLQVLGTVADWMTDWDGAMTVVRLDFENGSTIFRLHWREGRIFGIGGGSLREPAEFWLQPTDHGNTFGGYHLATTTTTQVQFIRDDDGRITSLVAGSEAGPESVVFLRV